MFQITEYNQQRSRYRICTKFFTEKLLALANFLNSILMITDQLRLGYLLVMIFHNYQSMYAI